MRDAVNYEGQAAIELEQRVDPAETGFYPATVVGEQPFQVRGVDLVRAVVTDLAAGFLQRSWPRASTTVSSS